MSISTGTISLPRKVENLKRYIGPISLDTLDGKLAAHVAPGGFGAIEADFVENPGQFPHSAIGSLVLYDGASAPILSVTGATIQVEAGSALPPWPGPTVGNFAARGLDSIGRPFFFQKTGEDETSVLVEFAVADDATLKGWSEVAAWAIGKGAT